MKINVFINIILATMLENLLERYKHPRRIHSFTQQIYIKQLPCACPLVGSDITRER